MDSEKKLYSTPRLTVYGKVEEVTQQNGASFIDVPIGTPCCNNIAGS